MRCPITAPARLYSAPQTTVRARQSQGHRYPDNYARAVEISADKDNLYPDFKDWRNKAQKQFDALLAQGLPVVKVMLDPEELLAWAIAEGRDINSTARAEFAVLVHEREKGQSH